MRSAPRAAVVLAILLLSPLPARGAAFAPGGAFRGTNEDEVFRLLFPGWNPAVWLTPAGEGLKMADARTWKGPGTKERLVAVVEHWKGDMEERRIAAAQGELACDIGVFAGRKGALTLLARAEKAVRCTESTVVQVDLSSYRMDARTRLIGVKLVPPLGAGGEVLTLFLLDGGTLRAVLEVSGGDIGGPANAIRLRAMPGARGKNAFVQELGRGASATRVRWVWDGTRYERAPAADAIGSPPGLPHAKAE